MEPNHRLTDAETAAMWAATALTEGRYALGRALANLAVEAARVEAAQQPLDPQVYAIPQRAADAQRDLFGDPAATAVTAPANGRCVFEVQRGGYLEPCHGVAYWDPNKADDQGRSAPGWRHMDTALDQDHDAQVNFTPAH